MRPLRGDDRVPATLSAAIATRECRLRRIVISGRIVALVALANATRVRRNSNRGQRQRGEVSRESEQQQKSGNRALHKCRRSRVPRSNKNSTDQIGRTNWRKPAQRRLTLPHPVKQHRDEGAPRPLESDEAGTEPAQEILALLFGLLQDFGLTGRLDRHFLQHEFHRVFGLESFRYEFADADGETLSG